jgi:hypothetical protein
MRGCIEYIKPGGTAEVQSFCPSKFTGIRAFFIAKIIKKGIFHPSMKNKVICYDYTRQQSN